jgi:dTDP-4-amino-4,6-dideoxygalactose transaminase/predicted O-linked N-acetylglucosamine transferase (SPINDLY family)
MMLAASTQDSGLLTVDQALQQAISYYIDGQFKESESLLQDILEAQPQHPDANHNLGVLLAQLRRYAESFPYFEAALNANYKSEQFWVSYIDALIQAGLVDAARQALVESQKFGVHGDMLEPLMLKLADDVGKETVPVGTSVEPVSTMKPTKPIKHSKLTKKKSSHQVKEPGQDEMDAVVDLFGKGSLLELEAISRDLIARYPESAFGWKVLSVALDQQGRSAEALEPAQKAVILSPKDAECHNNLGKIFQELGQLDEAEASCRNALKIKPNFAGALNNLGNTLLSCDRVGEAEPYCRRAIQIEPNNIWAHSNLGSILSSLGRRDEAEKSYRRAIEISPDFAGGHSNLLFSLTHNETISPLELFNEHCRFGEKVEGPLRTDWPQYTNSRDPDRCLQVGFVSADLNNHAVANFIEPLLMHLANFPKLSLHAYSNFSLEDGVTQRLRTHFKCWNSIRGLSDVALADKIRIDGIDILIDLSGHTKHNRLSAFARKPAPLQASWIGYPGTTGLKAMDYYFADPIYLPPGQFDDQFIEKIVYLPANSAFLPFEFSPPINTLPALEKGFVTFGSFNQTNKINPSVIALWSQLLREVPDSRMLLGAMPLDRGNDSLVEMFAREGIQSDRLSFYPRTGMVSYLKLHHQVDICLDTFPYNGGTTIHHALWMGVPTLTLAGHTVPARSGASILGHVKLETFIANDKEDFIKKGVFWVKNLNELAVLRGQLRKCIQQSPQGQPGLIAAGLEYALRAMWKRWCDGLAAESFDVSRQIIAGRTQTDALQVAGTQKKLPIYVTQPSLPPLEEFIPYLRQIWDSKQLTNGGAFHQQLEQELCDHLGVKHISLFSSGTLALMTAMQTLRITGEVITTPYSFVATAHSLLWNGIKPVFVDIDPITLNLDPSKIEAAITPQTTAIMPVHCYGHPCDVKRIQKIADNYGLKVIYDAAHAFGVQCPDGSILNHGDLSVLSFHATKVFNTFEGGAIVCHDAKTKQRIDHLKNFGFVDEVTVVAAGINGKMSEVNAAFGLLQLKSIDQALQGRKVIDTRYRIGLSEVKGIHCLSESGEKVSNYSYFPILVGSDYPLSRDELYQKLRDNDVYARRYFYPIVSDFPMYRGMSSAAHSNLPVAKRVADQVICLPIYPDLSNEQVNFISQLIAG